MSAVNRKKSSEGDKKQSRRQIEKLLDNFLKVKLNDRLHHGPATRFSVNAPVGTRSGEAKLTSLSLPSVCPPGAGSASLSEINNINKNSGTNNATSRERSDSASKRRGKLTLNWKKVKKPIAVLFNRSDSRTDQPQSSSNGKTLVNNNEISYNLRSGDRSNFHQHSISEGDDDVPETTERTFAEEAKKNESNGVIALTGGPAKLNVSRLSLLTALSKDGYGSSDAESPTDPKPGTEEDLRMLFVAQRLAALAEKKDFKLSDIQLGNCSYTTKKKTYKRFEKMANEALQSVGSIEITSPQDEGMAQIATILNLSTSIISTWGNIGDLAEKVKKHTIKFIHNTFAEWIIMQGGWGSFDPIADE